MKYNDLPIHLYIQIIVQFNIIWRKVCVTTLKHYNFARILFCKIGTIAVSKNK